MSLRRSALQWFGRCAVPAKGVAILGRQADERQIQVDPTAAASCPSTATLE
ncbi:MULTISPECIES: hypothetical protein [unclassified Mesorhizobium]|uniref:hypothetical protein n=1 Tax=unclassified Mesorhizobium TaxID=325217 RepID=UPI0015E34B8B|nr:MULTISPECIES: hypothetical protein [unclassified Mesorhizobium]